jgi:hypothetical protein
MPHKSSLVFGSLPRGRCWRGPQRAALVQLGASILWPLLHPAGRRTPLAARLSSRPPAFLGHLPRFHALLQPVQGISSRRVLKQCARSLARRRPAFGQCVLLLWAYTRVAGCLVCVVAAAASGRCCFTRLGAGLAARPFWTLLRALVVARESLVCLEFQDACLCTLAPGPAPPAVASLYSHTSASIARGIRSYIRRRGMLPEARHSGPRAGGSTPCARLSRF